MHCSVMPGSAAQLILLFVVSLGLSGAASADDAPLRCGIVGLDTSHAVEFARLLNSAKPASELAGVKVTVAFPGGSPDIPSSHDRVEQFTGQVRALGVDIVDSIDGVLSGVDVVMLETLDGRKHLEQARQILRAKKPVFIDKPLAASLADALEIYRSAEEQKVPCFSSSALRFGPATQQARSGSQAGDVLGCVAFSPCTLEPHHPDLFWYGIHGVETLFTIMGPGCLRVTRVHTDDTDVVVGVWKDGRVGSFRGLRTGTHDYGALVFGSKSIVPSGRFEGYEPLVREIVRFFKSGKSPVSPEETLEIYAFMEAADQSKRDEGRPVELRTVVERARAVGDRTNR